jgi:lysyl-tRNA synthetase class 1
MLPYFPVCENCGRIYTTTTQKFFLDEMKISYVCDGMKLHDQWIKGCNHKGEVDITKGEGKLSWKVEFAARWDALEINFEAYGKDIADSVRVNDRICKEILNYEPPMHVRYEMFLDRGGKKISKSKGNVFTPQVWLKYGSPQSLLLLMFKRITGTRTISSSEIPKYMDEIDELEQIFFDKKKIKDKKELAKLKGLFIYSWLLKPPANPGVYVPYNLLVYLSRVAPKDGIEDFIIEKLRIYNYIKDSLPEGIIDKINYAINWSTDFQQIEKAEISLSLNERNAINELIEKMQMEDDEERIQHAIFELAKKHDILPKNFFRLLYNILLGVPQGPRLGSYIKTMGKELVLSSLMKALKNSK